MGKKNSTDKNFDANAATIAQAREDYIKADADAEGILNAVSRAVWIIDNQTEPPEKVIATPLAISRRFSGFGKKERDDFVRGFIENKEMATVWEKAQAKRWAKIEETAADWYSSDFAPWSMIVTTIFLGLCEPPEGDEKPPGTIDVEKEIRQFNVIKYLRAIGEDMPEGSDKPLSIIVRAWQKDMTAVLATKQHDQRRPAAVLKYPMGSIRDVEWVDLDKGTLTRFEQRHGETPESYQMALPGMQEKLIVRPVQNLLVHDRRHEIAKMFGFKTPIKTKSGAVSPIVRISLEAILALEPGHTKGRVKITLGDLINFLNPDGKFHITNQLPYIVQAIYGLNTLAAVKWRKGWWLPVVARSYPEMTSDRDFPIVLDVELPDNATQGPMALKEPLRMTGKRSLPQFNAYLSAVDVWDRYGTQGGRITDPTRPVDYKQPGGERERDPKTDEYPIFSNLDLMTACYPNLNFVDMPGNQKRTYLTRAKAAWQELKKRGYVEIEKVGNVGWRILPTEDHATTYRALKKKVY